MNPVVMRGKSVAVLVEFTPVGEVPVPIRARIRLAIP
jgi:hypothetical protein